MRGTGAFYHLFVLILEWFWFKESLELCIITMLQWDMVGVIRIFWRHLIRGGYVWIIVHTSIETCFGWTKIMPAKNREADLCPRHTVYIWVDVHLLVLYLLYGCSLL